jgi:putative membrane protein
MKFTIFPSEPLATARRLHLVSVESRCAERVTEFAARRFSQNLRRATMKRMMWGASLALVAVSAASMAARADDAPKQLTDQDFVTKASAAGLAEVNFGKLAEEQSSNADVKKFAQHMVADHSKANTELIKVADKDKITPAEKMGAKDQQTFTKLVGLKGAEFDREYIASQLAAHKEAVALFKSESNHGKNEDLKEFATKTLPTLEHHLEMVEKLSGNDKDKKENKEK